MSDICPKCKKPSIKKSYYYKDMNLCFNKNCEWFKKDDIEKLKNQYNMDEDGFSFQRKPFQIFYEKLIENRRIKMNSSIIQTSLFIVDFLKKYDKNFIVIIDDKSKYYHLKKIMSKHMFKKHITIIRYNDFFNINIQSQNYLFINLSRNRTKSRKINKIIPQLANLYEIC